MRRGIIGVGPSSGEKSSPNLSYLLAKAVTVIFEKTPARWEFWQFPSPIPWEESVRKEITGLQPSRGEKSSPISSSRLVRP